MAFFGNTLGLAHPDPVSSLIAGSLESVFLNESFQQVQGMVINSDPVIGDSFGVKGQELRC